MTSRVEGVATLSELLYERAMAHPDRTAYTFIEADGSRQSLTYGQLDAKARALASRLLDVAAPGDRALLVYPQGLDFIVALAGCFYAGVTAVPTYPPHAKRPEPALSRLAAIIDDSCPSVILATAELREALEPRLAPGLPMLATDTLELSPGAAWHSLRLRQSSDLAMLQYTSGSTGTPRGVMLTHANLLANLRLIQQAFGTSSSSTGVFWLPFYHDMGLVGGVLETLYCGGHSLFFAAQAFVQSPIRWLETISCERATISGAPNFAYEECLRRITPEQCAGLDLSHWRLAFCGAEPVRPATLRQFAAKFAGCGFRQEALYPCYGLAEATLLVSGGPLKDSDKSPPLENPAAGTHPVVSCGPAIGGQQVIVVDPESRLEVSVGAIGEVWVAGHCVADGYYNQPEATQATFHATLADSGEGPFLRTGDLGFLRDGELYITGRLKDMIVVDGRNHFPQDIEQTVEGCHPSILPGGCGAFGVEIDGVERVVVTAEIDRHARRDHSRGEQAGTQQVLHAIRRSVAERHAVEVYQTVLVDPRTLPRTTSGKMRRHSCRDAFLSGQLDSVPTRSVRPK
ncbi:MAG TPA: fatty acyl-AMP ligase [Pirellulales bacterium]|jgi:acyl-CoA synthetase (AMP-forming)/AMP-acid ligase II|nr:fatty acyl-AMP ligase [Pirellulales bacterium]